MATTLLPPALPRAPRPPLTPPRFTRAGVAKRRTKGDIVRVELKRPEDAATWELDTPHDLEVSSSVSKTGREMRFLKLNKEQCASLGFGHYFNDKAASTRQLKLNVLVGASVAPGDTVPLSVHGHGTSLKEGWEGAELRVVLVRVAGDAE